VYIKFLNEISTNDNAGGKGNSLSKLVKCGFNVPPAFVTDEGGITVMQQLYQESMVFCVL